MQLAIVFLVAALALLTGWHLHSAWPHNEPTTPPARQPRP